MKELGITNIQSMTKPVQTLHNKSHVLNKNNFATMLKSALNEISRKEHEANIKTELLANGQVDNLHDVMITAQKASITVETAVQIQQKVIDAYNEMMRMQV